MKVNFLLINAVLFFSPVFFCHEQGTGSDLIEDGYPYHRLSVRQAPEPASRPKPPAAPKAPTSPKGPGAPAPKAGGGGPKAGGPPKAVTAPKAAQGGSDFSATAKGLPNFSGIQGHDLKKPEQGYGAAGGVYTGSWKPS